MALNAESVHQPLLCPSEDEAGLAAQEGAPLGLEEAVQLLFSRLERWVVSAAAWAAHRRLAIMGGSFVILAALVVLGVGPPVALVGSCIWACAGGALQRQAAPAPVPSGAEGLATEPDLEKAHTHKALPQSIHRWHQGLGAWAIFCAMFGIMWLVMLAIVPGRTYLRYSNLNFLGPWFLIHFGLVVVTFVSLALSAVNGPAKAAAASVAVPVMGCSAAGLPCQGV
jgi:hypothetical protein